MEGYTCSALFLTSLLFSLAPVWSKKALPPAIYIFGDSLSDSGNNNHLPTKAQANYFPYGVDYTSGATGRFTNGKTTVDFIAERLLLPHAPPYLGLSPLQRSLVLTGVNYASGSAGILPETGSHFGKCLSLGEQISLFEENMVKLRRKFITQELFASYLSKSIFVVMIGANDYFGYLQPELYNTSRLYSPEGFAQLLRDKLSFHLKRLYCLGARKFVVPEIGPIGCTPVLTNKVDPPAFCVDEANQLVSLYNKALPQMLEKLRSELPGLVFSRCGAAALAFSEFYPLNVPCCQVDSGEFCSPGLHPCAEREKHVFYDLLHPTEAVHSITAQSFFSKPSTCAPLSVEELARC